MPLYVIRAGDAGACKIGIAADVRKRIAGMQTASAVPLNILHVFEGGAAEERAIHREFAAHRLSGEWFNPAPGILAGAFDLVALPLPDMGRKIQASAIDHPLVLMLRAAGIPQTNLAQMLGVGKAIVSDWIHGRCNIKPEHAAAICALTGRRPHTLRPDVFGPDDLGAVAFYLDEITARTGVDAHAMRRASLIKNGEPDCTPLAVTEPTDLRTLFPHSPLLAAVPQHKEQPT